MPARKKSPSPEQILEWLKDAERCCRCDGGNTMGCAACVAERNLRKLGENCGMCHKAACRFCYPERNSRVPRVERRALANGSAVRKAKRKLKALGRAKAALLAAEQTIARHQTLTADLQKRIATLEGQLLEARRRTIPMADGSELNFLPLYISNVDVRHDNIAVRSHSGMEFLARGTSRATIVVEGETMMFTPKVKV
jgi:hypothetical protein